MGYEPFGTVLAGSADELRRAHDRWQALPVDQDLMAEGDTDGGFCEAETTLARTVSVTGPGTFFGRTQRTLTFLPTEQKGWWFKRQELPEALPIQVSVNNVWTTVRNIVLCSGSPHNYMRMVEHIVALKVGLGLDHVMISVDSGDPPLFDRGSMDLVEAIESAGLARLGRAPRYLTVKEPVCMAGPRGGFLAFLPAARGVRRLAVDCAVDFRNAIGRQRIRFVVNAATFRHGALARTNTTLGMMLYCKTLGMIFADVRNLGYKPSNILVAGPRRYLNRPRLVHNGKSLEAVWHRAALDLLAAVALIERGRFAGTIVSYKAGHALDVALVREIYRRDLLADL